MLRVVCVVRCRKNNSGRLRRRACRFTHGAGWKPVFLGSNDLHLSLTRAEKSKTYRRGSTDARALARTSEPFPRLGHTETPASLSLDFREKSTPANSTTLMTLPCCVGRERAVEYTLSIFFSIYDTHGQTGTERTNTALLFDDGTPRTTQPAIECSSCSRPRRCKDRRCSSGRLGSSRRALQSRLCHLPRAISLDLRRSS